MLLFPHYTCGGALTSIKSIFTSMQCQPHLVAKGVLRDLINKTTLLLRSIARGAPINKVSLQVNIF